MFDHLLVLLMLASPLLALNCNYDDFLQEFKPNQQPSQFSKERKQRFEQITCPQLNKMMQDSPQLVLNLNEDADLSQEELFLKKGLNNFEKIKPEDMKVGSIQNDQKLSATMMPRYLNYVIKGSVSSVQDQGSCGSFWAFAAVAYYLSQLLMRNKTEYQISQEAVLQCSYQQSIYPQPISSCSGGYFLDGLAYLAKFGGVSKRNYPYISGDYGSSKGFKIVPGICQQKNRIKIEKEHVNAYFDLQDEQLKLLLNTKGPVYAIFSANYYFSFYTSGIFEYCYVNAFSYLNHAVLVVGYSDNQRYWLVKNSWGTSWGEKGFGKIPYSRNCGLTLLVGIIDQKDVTVEAGENYMLQDMFRWYSQVFSSSNDHYLAFYNIIYSFSLDYLLAQIQKDKNQIMRYMINQRESCSFLSFNFYKIIRQFLWVSYILFMYMLKSQRCLGVISMYLSFVSRLFILQCRYLQSAKYD